MKFHRNSNARKSLQRHFLILTLFYSFFIVGCASLSDSQLKSIAKFSENYSSMDIFPGDMVLANAALQNTNHRLKRNAPRGKDKFDAIRACTDLNYCPDLDDLFESMTELRASETADKKLAQDINAILKPVVDYVAMLGEIVNLDEDKALRDSAQGLASSFSLAIVGVPKHIENAKSALNGTADTDDEKQEKVETANASSDKANKVSSYIGGITYWAGKKYLQRQQSKALKKAVLSADPSIKMITQDLIDIIQLFSSPPADVKVIGNYKEYAAISRAVDAEKKQKLVASLDATGLTKGSYTVGLTSEIEMEIQTALSQAKSTINALKKLKGAHHNLALSMMNDQSRKTRKEKFSHFIGQSKLLADELKTVKKFQKQLEQNLASQSQ